MRYNNNQMMNMRKNMQIIFQDPYASLNQKSGCRFCARCPHAKVNCLLPDLKLKEIENHHHFACVLYD